MRWSLVRLLAAVVRHQQPLSRSTATRVGGAARHKWFPLVGSPAESVAPGAFVALPGRCVEVVVVAGRHPGHCPVAAVRPSVPSSFVFVKYLAHWLTKQRPTIAVPFMFLTAFLFPAGAVFSQS